MRINKAKIKVKGATDPTVLRQPNTLDMNHWLGSLMYDSDLRILFTVVRTSSAIATSLSTIRSNIAKPDDNQRTLDIKVATVNAALTTVSSESCNILATVPRRRVSNSGLWSDRARMANNARRLTCELRK